ncbi:hypothetical protein SSP24_00910 [Streptomyces spinoverrucosus]|uniref:Lipoprotein n=1 Tax=Streptomyces spinoverrucosus TaxID=284043 RepID=A0A4Y3VBS3_9ACTN|nr:hypothetical protein [Streptomyces spinoverrucosus]GEC02436.1 hypothetical protein SSP24_00910 [Streptomyces spinoverrucosus]GHB42998.1 hypothetical protein GCM10010397_11680 [Streptomyces spinoverrucosus]
MKRWQSAIGLLLCLSAMQQASTLSYPAFWNDVGLLGFIFFLVMLCVGPRGLSRKRGDAQEKDAQPPGQ